MENIGWFSDFVTAYGVQKEYGFVTVDLYEKQNVAQVSSHFWSLSEMFSLNYQPMPINTVVELSGNTNQSKFEAKTLTGTRDSTIPIQTPLFWGWTHGAT